METEPARTQSLYRKYRPETFDQNELVGQDHISRTLKNAIAQGRVSHAYLFCGPRGTGKTTTARLLAKAVNCLDPDPANRPCNKCEACVAINQSRTTDVVEIDAASNRGIEDIRDLREQVKYAPIQLRHKFYIIDEAHRLTRDAFNAFLKTLEEPPPNTTFVLATTDPDELLETVASRCQRFDFHRIPAEKMIQRVRDVCEREGIEIDDEALEIIARHATGSLRDALGLVDMLTTAAGEGGDGSIDAELTRRMLGLSQNERTLGLIQAIADRDITGGLRIINEAVDAGQDMRSYGRQIISALRLLMLCRAGANPAEAGEPIRELAGRFELPDLLRVNREFSEIDFAIRNSGFPQLPIELAFLASVLGDQARAQPVVEEAFASAPPMPPPVERPRPAAASSPPRQRRETPVRQERSSRPEPAPAPEEPAPELQRAAAPAPTHPAALDEFIERWQEIRTEVKSLDRKVEALLASTDPGTVSDGTLTLVAAYEFHAGKLNESRNRTIIEQAVQQITGHQVAVHTVLRDEFTPPSRPDPAPQPDSPAPRRQVSEAPRNQANGTPPEDDGGDDDEEGERVVERMKAMFDAEEIDVDELQIKGEIPH